MSEINWLAVLAAAISTFAIGGVWYSPMLFGRAWMRANNLTEGELSKSNFPMIFGLSFLFAVIMAMNLAGFLANSETTVGGGNCRIFGRFWVGDAWPRHSCFIRAPQAGLTSR